MMKKSLSFALAILLLFTIASPCFATEITPEDVNSNLAARGYPADYLEKMDYSQKLIVYENPDMFFVDSFSIAYSENQSQNTIQPRGQISPSDLSLVFYISCVFIDDEFEHIFIQFYYEWLTIPVFRFQDPIYVSWNENKFRLEDDSFYKIDKYSCEIPNGNTFTVVLDQTHSLIEGYACASPSGVAWYADLKSNLGMIVTELYGYGCFRLVAAHDYTVNYGMSETLYANYVHPTASFGATISVGALGSFDISCLGGYDERGTHDTFTVRDDSSE